MQYKSDNELIFEQYNKILLKEAYGANAYGVAMMGGGQHLFSVPAHSSVPSKIAAKDAGISDDKIATDSSITGISTPPGQPGSQGNIWNDICGVASTAGSVMKGIAIATGIIGAAYSLFHIGTWVYDLYKSYKRSKSFKELTYKMYGKSEEVDDLLDNLNNLQISDAEKLDMVGKMIQQKDTIPTKQETIQKIVEDNYKKQYSNIIL